ncbi:hypothetical protein [Pseudomonas phage D6]|nr:hypothetical protein [Pseudomonas phage D6]
MYVKQGDVLCWDISHLMGLLREHPSSQLVISRAIRYHHHNERITEPNPYWDSLVDDWFCYTINSFQEVIIADFNPSRVTPQEITWFNMNDKARRELWLMLRAFGNTYAGTMVNYARQGGVIYLYAQTN